MNKAVCTSPSSKPETVAFENTETENGCYWTSLELFQSWIFLIRRKNGNASLVVATAYRDPILVIRWNELAHKKAMT
jgi:hypothetical protein